MNKYFKHAEFRECVYFFLYHGFLLFGWVSRKYHGVFDKGLKMSPLDIYKFKFTKIANFDICWLIKQYAHFRCSSIYLRSAYVMWGKRDQDTSIVITIVVTGLLVLMRHIGLIIKTIGTDTSSNSWWSFEEGIHATLTPLSSFDEFVGRSEGINDTGGEIVLVLGKVEAELKVEIYLKNTGVDIYAVDLADESK